VYFSLSMLACSCLKALRILQRSGYLPVDAALFKDYCV